ncbi:MAG TPA: type II secretion system F family protein [Propionibacteriaceae bacterium]|nr:type II secretion system F family protein [Propionibacteriaceae bacterium]
MSFFASVNMLTMGSLSLLVAITIAAVLIIRPGFRRLSRDRRRQLRGHKRSQKTSTLATATDFATDQINKMLAKRGRGLGAHLELAGLRTKPSDVVLLVTAAALALGAATMLFAGPILGLLVTVIIPVLGWLALGFLVSRRKRAFADQLDSTLQMMAASLRAGYSLLQAIQAMSTEADSPTKDEFSRVLNETRIGRPLNESLVEVSTRMGSEDFNWVAQAIAINREVGGNLADVLDGVAHTIRERNQLHRQVAALSAEGKLSAVILMALPFGVVAFLTVANPGYLNRLFTSTIGWIIVGVAIVMLIVGGIWLRATVKIKF